MIRNKFIFFTIIFFLFNYNLLASESDQVNTQPDDFETSKVEDEIYDPCRACK